MDTIEHEGVIAAVEGDHVRVSILQIAACGACKARSLCSLSESREKIIDVYEDDAARKYRVGEQVKVCGTLRMGRTAVRLAFGIPLALTALWMPVALVCLGWGDWPSVGVLVLILTIYFFILYIMRNKMARHFSFWIERSDASARSGSGCEA